MRLDAADDLGNAAGASSWDCPGLRARGCRPGRSRCRPCSPLRGEDRQHDVARRARIGGAFQHDQLAGPQHGGDLRGPWLRRSSGPDRGSRSAAWARRSAGSRLRPAAACRPWARSVRRPRTRRSRPRGNVPDVALAGRSWSTFGWSTSKPIVRKPAATKARIKRQAHVAQAHHAHAGRILANRRFQIRHALPVVFVDGLSLLWMGCLAPALRSMTYGHATCHCPLSTGCHAKPRQSEGRRTSQTHCHEGTLRRLPEGASGRVAVGE